MEPTERASDEKANADPGGTDAGELTSRPHHRKQSHAADEEGGSGGHCPSPPMEQSKEADGETLGDTAGREPRRTSCGYPRGSDGPDIIQARQSEEVVCVPVFLRQFSDARPSTRTRVYQVWPGRNVFFLRGYIICGPDPRGFLLTALSVLLSTWIFCFYVVGDSPEASPLIIIAALILALIVMVSLMTVAATDPGIVQRNRLALLLLPEEAAETSHRTWSSRVIRVDGIETRQKYCRVCGVFRPPRSCHCAVCDNCVERFDHHCPWVGQCIGLRNYRFYVVFISSALLFFAYVLVFAWRRVARVAAGADASVFVALRVAPETVALGLFGAVAVWFLGGLVVFHCYLISVNQTASENFKQRYKGSRNPYDKGIFKNIKEALFVRLPPSKVDFRAEIEPPCLSGTTNPRKADGAEAAAAAAPTSHRTQVDD